MPQRLLHDGAAGASMLLARGFHCLVQLSGNGDGDLYGGRQYSAQVSLNSIPKRSASPPITARRRSSPRLPTRSPSRVRSIVRTWLTLTTLGWGRFASPL